MSTFLWTCSKLNINELSLLISSLCFMSLLVWWISGRCLFCRRGATVVTVMCAFGRAVCMVRITSFMDSIVSVALCVLRLLVPTLMMKCVVSTGASQTNGRISNVCAPLKCLMYGACGPGGKYFFRYLYWLSARIATCAKDNKGHLPCSVIVSWSGNPKSKKDG